MNLHTFSARAAAALVAAVAGAASYEHIASVALGASERDWVAYSLPIAIDGLIVVGVAALLEDRAAGRRGRALSAWTAIVVGVIATLAANVASAEPTATARLVAIAAPVSFLIAVEVLTRSTREVAGSPNDEPESDDIAADQRLHAAGSSNDEQPRSKFTQVNNDHALSQQTASLPSVVKAAAAKRPAPRRSARSRVEKLSAKMPSASTAELAGKLGLSEATVRRYRPAPPDGTVNASNGHRSAS